MSRQVTPGINEFLRDYPRMAIKPALVGSYITLSGVFDFTANSNNGEEIADSYSLRILVPTAFPRDIPEVTEIGHRIPRNGDYHVNPDGTLCLGSRLRLLLQISFRPTLNGFAEACLIPYLYAASYKLKFGGEFLFSELQHGAIGELHDYVDLFGLKDIEQAKSALRLLAMKKRIANKYPCPCGCGRRLGKCSFNDKLKKFRDLAERDWFKKLVS